MEHVDLVFTRPEGQAFKSLWVGKPLQNAFCAQQNLNILCTNWKETGDPLNGQGSRSQARLYSVSWLSSQVVQMYTQDCQNILNIQMYHQAQWAYFCYIFDRKIFLRVILILPFNFRTLALFVLLRQMKSSVLTFTCDIQVSANDDENQVRQKQSR